MALGLPAGLQSGSLGTPERVLLSDHYTTGGALSGVQDWLDAGDYLHQDVEIQTLTGTNIIDLAGTKNIVSTAPITLQAGRLEFRTLLKKRFRSDGTPWASTIDKGDTTFTAPNTTGLAVGDMMVITCSEAWENSFSYGKSYCGIITGISGNDVTCNKTALFNWDAAEADLTVDFWDVARVFWSGMDLDGAAGSGLLAINNSRVSVTNGTIDLPGDDVTSVDGLYFTSCYESTIANFTINGGRYAISANNGFSNVFANITAGYGALTRHPVDVVVAERDTVFSDWDLGGNVSSPAPPHSSFDQVCRRMNGSCVSFSPRSVGFVMEDCTLELTGTTTNRWQTIDIVADSGAKYSEHPMSLEDVNISSTAQNFAISGNADQTVTIHNCRLPGVGNKSNWTTSSDGSLTVTDSTIGGFGTEVGGSYGGFTMTDCVIDGTIPELFDYTLQDALIDGNGGNDGVWTLTRCTIQNGNDAFNYVIAEVNSTDCTFKDIVDWSSNGHPATELHTRPVLDNIQNWPFTSAAQYSARFVDATLLNGTTPPT